MVALTQNDQYILSKAIGNLRMLTQSHYTTLAKFESDLQDGILALHGQIENAAETSDEEQIEQMKSALSLVYLRVQKATLALQEAQGYAMSVLKWVETIPQKREEEK